MLKQVQELNPEKSDPQPQQRLIWRGGGGTLTEAVLKAVKACASEATLKNDADILVKGKLPARPDGAAAPAPHLRGRSRPSDASVKGSRNFAAVPVESPHPG